MARFSWNPARSHTPAECRPSSVLEPVAGSARAAVQGSGASVPRARLRASPPRAARRAVVPVLSASHAGCGSAPSTPAVLQAPVTPPPAYAGRPLHLPAASDLTAVAESSSAELEMQR